MMLCLPSGTGGIGRWKMACGETSWKQDMDHGGIWMYL